MDALPGLVVLDDPARREGRDVDAVDLPGEVEARLELQAALELRGRALGAERDLEPARDERELRARLVADELLEVAPERLLELGRLEVGQLEPHPAAERLV